jgi:hypothetical protein
MSYCRNCGNEVSENAYVCTKCGSLVNSNAKIKEKIIKDKGSVEFHQTVSFWLLFISGIFAVISVLFFNLSIYYIEIYEGTWTTWIYLEYTMSNLAFIASCIVLLLCVLSYALSFKLVRQNVISKTTNNLLLLAMIISIIYAFTKFMMVV